MREFTTYPNKEKISKNKHTANCYRNIREAYRLMYLRKSFNKPMFPREKEFLQYIKKYLNDMERKLLLNDDMGE